MKDKQALIDVASKLPDNWVKTLYQATSPVVERFLGIHSINHTYQHLFKPRYHQPHVEAADFFDYALDVLNISIEVEASQLVRIPTEGPLVVVANHPLGGLDGVALASLIIKRRKDLRLIVNYLLSMIPELKPWLFTVDPFEVEDKIAQQKNLHGMKMAYQWLKDGHCIATFPSGTVSYLHPKYKRIQDPEWHPHLARMAQKTKATIVPMYFADTNSWLFQAASFIHPRLRTALLARELTRYHAPVRVHIGHPITPSDYSHFKNAEALTDYLRLSTYMTGYYRDKKTPKPQANTHDLISLNLSHRESQLQTEIETLPAEHLIYDSPKFSVIAATKDNIPHAMVEIGRLREITFRAIGEGTGTASDLDAFDEYYTHIILWDKSKHCIVGCYRLGFIDQIIAQHGVKGVYTATLFDYQNGILDCLGKAVELGRSFIVKDYQLSSALSYLWKGVAMFIAKHPDYHQIIGPVSISPLYQYASQAAMVYTLKQHYWDSTTAPHIVASKPPKHLKLNPSDKQLLFDTVQDASSLSQFVSSLENDKKGIPPLLKHYIKMGAKVMSFNIDPAFGNDLDILMRLDLDCSNPKLLRQYMTPEYYEAYVEYRKLKLPHQEG